MSETDRELYWMGSTQEDISGAPDSVKREFGYLLRTAQQGETADGVRRMKGHLREVMECVAEDATGTYRLMYAAQIGERVYVLDFFQKKSKRGIATPQLDLDRIAARLQQAKLIEHERNRA